MSGLLMHEIKYLLLFTEKPLTIVILFFALIVVALQIKQDYLAQKSETHLGGIHLAVEHGKPAFVSLEELDLVVQSVALVQGRKHHKQIFCG